MCYLDIHPAHILLAFFWLHPSVLGNLAPNSTCPPLGNWTRRLQSTKWTGCLVEPLAGSSRPQELFRNWRSGPLVIPRTGSVRAQDTRWRTLLLTWNKHKLAFCKQTSTFVRQNWELPLCRMPTYFWSNLKESKRLHIWPAKGHDKCGAGDQSNCSREWCHGRCCEPAGRGLGYS